MMKHRLCGGLMFNEMMKHHLCGGLMVLSVIGLSILSWQFWVYDQCCQTTQAQVTDISLVNSSCEHKGSYVCHQVDVDFVFMTNVNENDNHGKLYTSHRRRYFGLNKKAATAYVKAVNDTREIEIWYDSSNPNENYLQNPRTSNLDLQLFILGIVFLSFGIILSGAHLFIWYC